MPLPLDLGQQVQDLALYGHVEGGRRLVGDEKALRAGLARLREAGVTDFCAAVAPLEPGAGERTLEFLASEL